MELGEKRFRFSSTATKSVFARRDKPGKAHHYKNTGKVRDIPHCQSVRRVSSIFVFNFLRFCLFFTLSCPFVSTAQSSRTQKSSGG